MTELFLIAHKVSGEAAFDVASKMECPVCRDGTLNERGCVECDEEGFWWIIPTSGHRAYPYWSKALDDLHGDIVEGWAGMLLRTMPHNIQDHYRHGPAPKVDIKALFKKSEWVPNPEAFIKRRL